MSKQKALTAKKIERKLKLSSDLFTMAFQMKRFQIEQKHPQLSEKEVIQRAYDLIEKGCS